MKDYRVACEMAVAENVMFGVPRPAVIDPPPEMDHEYVAPACGWTAAASPPVPTVVADGAPVIVATAGLTMQLLPSSW